MNYAAGTPRWFDPISHQIDAKAAIDGDLAKEELAVEAEAAELLDDLGLLFDMTVDRRVIAQLRKLVDGTYDDPVEMIDDLKASIERFANSVATSRVIDRQKYLGEPDY